MRKSNNPVRVKPEQVNIGDMIEVRWETEGLLFSVTAYVGLKEHPIADADYVMYAANLRAVLFKYHPGDGITYPDPQATLYRHRKAPDNIGAVLI